MPYHVGKSSECPSGKPHAVIKTSDGEVMGCHSSVADAEKQIAAIHASEGSAVEETEVLEAEADAFHLPGKHNQKSHGNSTGPKYDRSKPTTGDTVALALAAPAATGDAYEAAVPPAVGTEWEGVIVVEGVETGDGRLFSENAVTWVNPTDAVVSLRRNIEESHGGTPTTKTVLVGRINEIYRDADNPAVVRARGVFDDNGTEGREALRLVREGFLRGISVDPDSISDADVELVFPESTGDELADMFANPELTIYHAGRLRAATLVDIPAFAEAQIYLAPDTPMTGVTAASHFGSVSDRVWNGAATEQRLGATMSLATARSAYAHTANGAVASKLSVRFLHHEVEDGGGIGPANITACSVGLRALNAGRAATLTRVERHAAYEHLAQHLRAAGLTPPPFEDEEVLIAAAAEYDRPPAEWFADPGFTTRTPVTVTDERTPGGWRRIYGHGAEWGTCHTAFADACTIAPREPHGEHSYFRLGEVTCADGSRVAVGTITLGTGHAPVRGVTSSQAAEHYDNTGTAVAYVASGEDAHGIWVAGAVKPDVAEPLIVALQAAPLSGDWRRIGGQLRLVAFLAVNHPGFPVPRPRAFVSQSRQLSLVAAGVVTQDMRSVTVRDEGARAAYARIARTIGRDPATRLAELRRRVRGE